jgi:hypothetical protein
MLLMLASGRNAYQIVIPAKAGIQQIINNHLKAGRHQKA